ESLPVALQDLACIPAVCWAKCRTGGKGDIDGPGRGGRNVEGPREAAVARGGLTACPGPLFLRPGHSGNALRVNLWKLTWTVHCITTPDLRELHCRAGVPAAKKR